MGLLRADKVLPSVDSQVVFPKVYGTLLIFWGPQNSEKIGEEFNPLVRRAAYIDSI